MINNTFVLNPSATNLIESMRSIGYSFETAISDIIDNSISADANVIQIFLNLHDGEPIIQVIDNGKGMNRDELIIAMKLGSKNPNQKRNENDLGRFGLGMKSASFSQCRELTVISKKNNELHGLKWDLDYIKESDSFEIIILNNQEIKSINNIDLLNNEENGTIVTWKKFDKIEQSSSSQEEELITLMNISIDHIALVYHRYLVDNISIFVNNELIKPKDPFLKHHPGTQQLQYKNIIIEGEKIHLQPYILPHFSNLNAKDKRLSGKVSEQYQNQGFYLYRNKRLIVWGSYLGLSRKSELTKNLRIQVDLPNTLDYLWDIDIKKSSAKIPSKIANNLLSAITDGENISTKVNTYKGKIERTTQNRMWNIFYDRDNNFFFQLNYNHPTFTTFLDNLTIEQEKIFNILIGNIENSIPYNLIYSEIASGNKEGFSKKLDTTEDFITHLNDVKQIKGFNFKQYLLYLLTKNELTQERQIIEIINKELGGL